MKLPRRVHLVVVVLSTLWLLGPLSANATATVNNALVTNAGSYGDGHVFVYLNMVIPESGCSVNRFDVPASAPGAKQILAVAMTALATGKAVTVSTDGCLGTYAAQIVSPGSGYFLLAQ